MLKTILLIAIIGTFVVGVQAQTTEFTYQGFLSDGANPANGNYDLEFKLFNLLSGGAQQGSTLQRLNVPIAQGIFTVSLDFGAGALSGADRFLDIAVRTAGGGAFTPLSPRQKVNSAPYSVRSLNSTTADVAANATQLGGVAANQYVVTTDPRMTDARTPLANSPNYIQNTAIQQAASNFNISGNGTAGGTISGNVVNAVTQFDLGGNRILTAGGTVGTSLGLGAGPIGFANTFIGANAGSVSGGNSNTFVGARAGEDNTTGTFNAFFGASAGRANTVGGSNSFFGALAGTATTGIRNSFFGSGAGDSNTSGSDNTFFGRGAGSANTTGENNALFGTNAGFDLASGDRNSFFGDVAGLGISTGSDLSMFGAFATAANGLINAAAIGHRASVTQSNSMVLGSILGVNSATADTNVGIGTTSPARRLHVSSGASGATSLSSSDFVIEDNNAAFQHFLTPDDVESGILFGDPSATVGGGIIFNNAIANNGIQFRAGGNTTRMTLTGSGSLGIGTVAPLDKLDVIGSIRVAVLGVGGPTTLCRNPSNQISDCSSSFRYKSNIGRFTDGLSFVNRLRPITFDWTANGMKDLGFGAEDIAAIDPRFVTYNSDGLVEGVKYDRLSVAFVNAFKEQQAQIEKQQATIELQQKQLDEQRAQIQALLRLACSQTSDPTVCRP